MSTQQRTLYALILGMLAALGPLCTDFYLPALPDITAHLQVSTSATQLTLTASLVGLGLGQLVFGPLSDRMGRKVPLLASLIIFILASIGCAIATNMPGLMAARFIQGLAGAGGQYYPGPLPGIVIPGRN
ncbi:MFS transporter [Mangrovibacter sp. SLW1]